jgi:NADH-quinone oxidoreductase subunit J
MAVATFFFYIFAAMTVASAFMVIAGRNPVHSVLFLILAFFSAAGLFLIAGAEFLALVLVIVYVGAVAVLFLFVVMMLDIDFAELREGFLNYLPVGGLVGLLLLLEIILVIGGWVVEPDLIGAVAVPLPSATSLTNTEALGLLLYTDYIYFFQTAGIILLVAMIGAIVLTLRHKKHAKRQDISIQIARNPTEAIKLVDVKPGQGI